MLGLIKNFIPGNILGKAKMIFWIVVIVAVLGLAASWKMRGAKIDELNKDIGTLTNQITVVEGERDVAIQTNEDNIAEFDLTIAAERADSVQKDVRLAELQRDFNSIRGVYAQLKSKTDAQRLARLADAKGGLLTKISPKFTEKRNQEWEALGKEHTYE